ncbi:MAG: SDR family oxidoreductase [Pseudoclavibacter sp.]
MSERRVVLVTGGARGVGRAIVKRFARQGDRVVLNYFHSVDRARAVEEALQAQGLDVVARRGSVARESQRAALFDWITETYGRLDVLVNNAAMGFFAPSEATTQEQLRRSFEVNVDGSLACAQLAMPLLATARGRIVNLSSVGSGLVVGNYTSVGTSKAAVESMTRYLAAEWARYGIRVNCVSGGLIAGEVADAFPNAVAMQDAVRDATPLGRLGTPEELADVVAFLCSPQASWITGQTVIADGGLSLGGSMLAARDEWLGRVDEARRADHAPTAPSAIGDPAATPPPVEPFAQQEPQDPTQLRATPGFDDAIVVVGSGIVVPGASSAGEFWDVLRQGPELLRDANPDRIRSELFASPDADAMDKTYQIASGYADQYTPDAATAAELGPDRRATDYPTQWFRHAVRDALRDVTASGRVGCAIGYTADGNQHLEEALVVESMLADIDAAATERGRDSELIAQVRARLLERYPLYGHSQVAPLPSDVGNDAVRDLFPSQPEVSMIDTACSSSLYALDIAVKGLLEGQHDVAVCGGTFAVGPRNAVLFAKLHGLSPSGELRPLDEDCDGVLFSDGAAAVVLKRHADAVRDGDPILGFVGPTGASSDGKGKAIYAPNVRGQKLAIARAAEKSGGAALDWIVAHATGTPAGDLCEITSIRDTHPNGTETVITSNKSLVGHTGWAAGVVSLIQVLLSLEHETILPQLRFERAPDSYGLAGTGLSIPRSPISWSRDPERIRRAAISGFGFGGTNAHLIVQDRPFQFAVTPAAPSPGGGAEDADIVITAWAADLPGSPDHVEVESWAMGRRSMPASFGDEYSTAGFGVRMPPRVLRTLDRSQLMAVRCALELQSDIGKDLWSSLRQRIGVFVGHMGPTHNAVMYARRCHLDATFDAVSGCAGLDDEILTAVRASVYRGVVESNEDSFPGIMPNIISARISNQLDTNGPNMGVDTGAASTLTALETAAKYLRAGEIDLAVVGGVHGNSTRVVERILSASVGREVRAHEGAVMFAVTRRATALEHSLPILGSVHELRIDEVATDREEEPLMSSAFYGGAESAREVLGALIRGGRSEVRASTGVRNPAVSLTVRSTSPAVGEIVLDETAITDGPPPPQSTEDTRPPSVSRWDRVWMAAPADPGSGAAAGVPDGALVLTSGDASVVRDLLPPDVSVLSSAHFKGASVRPSIEMLDGMLGEALSETEVRDVRVVLDLTTIPGLALDPGTTPALDSLLAAHDLMFLTAKALESSESGGRSFGVCLLGAWPQGTLHPLAGLFLGFTKSLALELNGVPVRAVAVDSDSPAVGLDFLERELRIADGLPTAAYRDGVRYREGVREASRGVGAPFLTRDSTVVATAGGKGITSLIVRALAERFECRLELIGSTDLEQAARMLGELGGEDALSDRGAFIRAERARGDGRSVADINQRFEQLIGALEILRTLEHCEHLSGAGRVRYHCADVTDQDAVAAAVTRIEQDTQRVDLVVHGAGINRAAGVSTKTLSQFRAVRDVKVGGYLNLKRAFSRPPAHWCSFSSLIGLTGQRGETDYASSNDFLVSAAGFERECGSTDEFSIGWTLWRDAGMAASSVHQSFFTGAMSDVLTLMPSEEGVDLFMREIDADQRTSGVVHIGEVELRSIERVAPGFFTPASLDTAKQFYVDSVQLASSDEATTLRKFANQDAFLAGHAVGGVGTLPGCFVAEVIVEAALALRPGLVPRGIRDLEFHSFLRLDGPATRSPLRSRAKVRAEDEERVVIDVVVTADVALPTGRVLARDKLFYRGTVILAPALLPAPTHVEWPDAREVPILDPYHSEGSPVRLRDEFVSTARTRLHPLGKRADHRAAAAADSPYASMRLPVLLMDGLVRLAVLERDENGEIPVAAPTRIGRIDYYDSRNDAELTAAGERIELYATPLGLGIGIGEQDAKFWAVGNGRVLLQFTQVEGVVLGSVKDVGESLGATAGPAPEMMVAL